MDMLKNRASRCRHVRFILLVFSLGLVIYGVADAANPDVSYWIKNLSSSDSGVNDENQEIAVVGDTVHVMWMTRSADDLNQFYYRRSLDGGETWEAKQLIFSTNKYVDWNNTYKRMAVDGNTVHIATNLHIDVEGSWYEVLKYIRSINNGASFEAARTLFPLLPTDPYVVRDIFVATSDGKTTICFKHQCNWLVDNTGYLLNTDDQGETFTLRIVYNVVGGGGQYRIGDMQRVGNKIFVAYTRENVDGFTLISRNLYVASSTDAGVTFGSKLVSIPSLDGQHKADWLQADHYVPKIANAGNNVTVIWSGLDGADVRSVFSRYSANNGTDWGDAMNLSKGVWPAGKTPQGGRETLAAQGNYVYALAESEQRNIYLRRSTSGGAGFLSLQELTTPGTDFYYEPTMPVMQIDPSDPTGAKIHVLWERPAYVHSSDGGATFTRPSLMITFASGYARPSYIAVGPDSKVHLAMKTAFGGDYDIFYRNWPVSAPGPTGGNRSLKLTGIWNDRWDNMQIRASDSLHFTNAITVELWVKQYPGGDKVRCFFNKAGQPWGEPAYWLGTTPDDNDKRKPQVRLRTTDGVSSTTTFLDPPGGVASLPDNIWSHLAFTFDAGGGANNFKLYLNGQQVAVKTVSGNVVWGEDLSFVCGYNSGNGTCEVDELRLWDRARTQAELAANMSRSLAGEEPNLAAYYNFNNTTRDFTGHGNDGFLMYKEQYIKRGGDIPEIFLLLLLN
jgi:hypothetical protein